MMMTANESHNLFEACGFDFPRNVTYHIWLVCGGEEDKIYAVIKALPRPRRNQSKLVQEAVDRIRNQSKLVQEAADRFRKHYPFESGEITNDSEVSVNAFGDLLSLRKAAQKVVKDLSDSSDQIKDVFAGLPTYSDLQQDNKTLSSEVTELKKKLEFHRKAYDKLLGENDNLNMSLECSQSETLQVREYLHTEQQTSKTLGESLGERNREVESLRASIARLSAQNRKLRYDSTLLGSKVKISESKDEMIRSLRASLSLAAGDVSAIEVEFRRMGWLLSEFMDSYINKKYGLLTEKDYMDSTMEQRLDKLIGAINAYVGLKGDGLYSFKGRAILSVDNEFQISFLDGDYPNKSFGTFKELNEFLDSIS